MPKTKQPVIDVVIPAHEKDLETLNHCIAGIRRNIADVRRIIVISKQKYTDKAEWFDEALFPFTYREIGEMVNGGTGWHFQQLLKLYSPLVIPDISENVLIIDSDTVFLRKVKFFSPDGLPFYNLSKDLNLENSDFHQVTFKHILKILPEIEQNFPEQFRNISGICHHMLFQKHLIQELFSRVESHDPQGDPFYKVFLKNSERAYGVAEYNLYFYFLVSLHPKEYQIRVMRYKNTCDFRVWKYRWRKKYHYCSFHSYMREGRKNILSKISENTLKKLLRFFYFEHWNIGVIESPIQEILKSDPKISWISDKKSPNFQAYPFGFEITGKKYVIFEDYSQIKKRGRIAISELRDDLTLSEKKIILDDKKHLSYPFIINHQNRIFLLCESYKAQRLSLYEIDQENLEAKKVRDIFTDKKVIDPTLIYYRDKFWLFYTMGNAFDSKLYIAFADSLFDEFRQHPQNPVKNDAFSARSAGMPFMCDGQLYRPAQNCSESSTSSIVINRVVELNEKIFREEFVKEIKPNVASGCNGFHTLSTLTNLTLIDGKTRIFTWYKPLISLTRNLVRILK